MPRSSVSEPRPYIEYVLRSVAEDGQNHSLVKREYESFTVPDFTSYHCPIRVISLAHEEPVLKSASNRRGQIYQLDTCTDGFYISL